MAHIISGLGWHSPTRVGPNTKSCWAATTRTFCHLYMYIDFICKPHTSQVANCLSLANKLDITPVHLKINRSQQCLNSKYGIVRSYTEKVLPKLGILEIHTSQQSSSMAKQEILFLIRKHVYQTHSYLDSLDHHSHSHHLSA